MFYVYRTNEKTFIILNEYICFQLSLVETAGFKFTGAALQISFLRFLVVCGAQLLTSNHPVLLPHMYSKITPYTLA